MISATGIFFFIVYGICSFMYYSLYIDELLAVGPAVKAGALEIAQYSRDQYINLLLLAKKATQILFAIERREPIRTTHFRVSQVLESLYLDNSNAKLRKQPLLLVLQGPPGTGKTTIAIDIAIALLKARYGKAYADEIVTLNENDEFQSEFRTNHKVVIFDDLDADNPNHSSAKNPFHKIIDFVNNINKTSLNPNVEMKGNIYINPDLVIVTTNQKGFAGAFPWVNCTSALIRRISRQILITRDGMEQTFLVMRPTFTHSSANDFRDEHQGRTYNLTQGQSEVLLETASKEVFLSELRGLFLEHLRKQQDFVDEINSRFDTQTNRNRTDMFLLFKTSVSYIKNLFRKELKLNDNQIMAQGGTVIPPCYSKPLYKSFLENVRDSDYTHFAFLQGGVIYKFQSKGLSSETLWNIFDFCGVRLPMISDKIWSYRFSWWTREEFDSLVKSKEEEQNDEDKPRSSENSSIPKEISLSQPMLNPGYTLPTFEQRPPKDDPLMKELLATLPSNLKLVLREWVFPNGIGDFVFAFKNKHMHYLVVEVKKSKVDSKQLRRTVYAFNAKFRREYVHAPSAIYCMHVNSFEPFIVHQFNGPSGSNILEQIQRICVKWYTDFQALRCANSSKLR